MPRHVSEMRPYDRGAARVRPAIRPAALVLAAMLAGAVLPSSAHAQFGGLVKKIRQKAATRSEAVDAATPAPAYTSSVLEITDGRIAQLLKGLDAERAERPKLAREDAAAQAAYETALREYAEQKAAYDRDLAAYQPKFDAYERCSERVEAKYEKEAADDPSPEEKERAEKARDAELEARARRMESLAERMQAANARGDHEAAMAIADSVRRESAANRALGAAAAQDQQQSNARDRRREEDRAKCGDPGKAPVPPTPPSALDHHSSAALERAGVRASGLTNIQYAVLRERVAAYVNAQGEFGPGNKYAFSEDEVRVLRRHLQELTARGPDLAPYGAWRFAPKGS